MRRIQSYMIRSFSEGACLISISKNTSFNCLVYADNLRSSYPHWAFTCSFGLCIAVTREIHKVDFIVNVVIIDGLGLTGLGTGPCQRLTVHQPLIREDLPTLLFPANATSGCIFSGSLLVIPQTVSRLTFFMIIKLHFCAAFAHLRFDFLQKRCPV